MTSIICQIDGEKVETMADFVFLGSKITAEGDCNHEIQRHLLFRRKAMTKLDRVLKSRDITLPTKLHNVKAVDFLVVMYRCECWTIKLSAEELMLLNCLVVKSFPTLCDPMKKTLESPLDIQKIKPVNPKGSQP